MILTNTRFTFVIFPAIAQASALADGARELSADRPDVTQSPITLEPGRVQIASDAGHFAARGD